MQGQVTGSEVGVWVPPRTRLSLELLDPGQHAQVPVVAQVHVVPVGVPGVEGMEADHVQALRKSRERKRMRMRKRGGGGG